MERAPKGKLLLIGSEDIEVWPAHCVDGHRCIQCFFTGMKGCAPRFWLYASRLKHQPEYPADTLQYRREESKPSISLDRLMWKEGKETLADVFPGQPLIPMPDGGYVEETTNAVMSRTSKKQQPSRDIDHDCEVCGHPFLVHISSPYYQIRKRHGKVTREFVKEEYRCRRCGRVYSKDSTWLPKKGELYLCELREQGISVPETIELVRKNFGVKIQLHTYYRILKRRGVFSARNLKR